MIANALSRKTVAALSLLHNDWRLVDDGALLAQLKAQHVLKQMIIDAQKKDEELQKKVQLVKANDKIDFYIREYVSLYFQNRLCVPTDNELRKELLHEAHNSMFTMHPGGNRLYQDLKQYF